MKRFIAYFDYLGFKEFIENNDLDYQKKVVNENFRDIEAALGHGKLKNASHGVVSDFSKSQINCINFSDTIVFFTNDTTKTSLVEILKVAYEFNWKTNMFCFPVRGVILLDEMIFINYEQKNEGGGIYNINSVYGKGLVKAYLRAEEQNWAGTVLDESFIDEITNKIQNSDGFLLPYAKKYMVPYKTDTDRGEEYVLNIIEGELDEERFKNESRLIKENFAQHNKSVSDNRVQQKIANTIRFLESYYPPLATASLRLVV